MTTHVVRDLRKVTLEKHIMRTVEPGSRISSDEFGSYKGLGKLGYKHRAVDHTAKQWVDGDTHGGPPTSKKKAKAARTSRRD